MAESFRKLVVRTYAPRRRAVLLGLSIVAGVLSLYGAFESGRYDGGYRVVESMRSAWAANARIRALESEITGLRAQIAQSEVARRVDREGYRQVEHSLGDMQNQIARLNEDLAFYRGLVQPDSVVKVKVQQLQILPGATANRYHLKFDLMQVGKPTGAVSGHVDLTLQGQRQGKPDALKFAQIASGPHQSLSYSFRYFQNYDVVVQLPPNFAPDRIDVELFSGKAAARGYRQAFLWKTRGMSSEMDPAVRAQSKGVLDVQAQKK
ncbi:MAG: hypothetical protein KGL92_00675 [Gammaproteobacteria bacterium]|nr:hypothetical protein [Gammaproteobacteria bacterium]MDE2346992.1 hypothetical protein [Gammaproteobacteria bacterium]